MKYSVAICLCLTLALPAVARDTAGKLRDQPADIGSVHDILKKYGAATEGGRPEVQAEEVEGRESLLRQLAGGAPEEEEGIHTQRRINAKKALNEFVAKLVNLGTNATLKKAGALDRAKAMDQWLYEFLYGPQSDTTQKIDKILEAMMRVFDSQKFPELTQVLEAWQKRSFDLMKKMAETPQEVTPAEVAVLSSRLSRYSADLGLEKGDLTQYIGKLYLALDNWRAIDPENTQERERVERNIGTILAETMKMMSEANRKKVETLFESQPVHLADGELRAFTAFAVRWSKERSIPVNGHPLHKFFNEAYFATGEK